MTEYSYQWIESDQSLLECCQKCQQQTVLAVDTEFMRSTTFYPKAALFQIYDGEETYLIDPVAISNFDPLVDLLTNASITKVFHSCSEDLEVFQYFLQCVPEPLVDTQIAASLLNYGSALGYANLVNKLLNIELEKGETRSDWLQRPLQEKQIHYAIQDVHYLLHVYHQLIDQLRENGRYTWLQEECARLIGNAKQSVDIEDYYLKIKSAWKMNSSQLAVLKALCTWREQKARELDLPRNHIVPEKAIVELARLLVEDESELKGIKDLHRRKRQLYGSELLEIVAKTKAANAKNIDDKANKNSFPRPLNQNQRDLLKFLKAEVEALAEKNQLPMEVLAKKNDLEALIRTGELGDFQLPPRLLGWRQPLLGDSLLKLANQSHR